MHNTTPAIMAPIVITLPMILVIFIAFFIPNFLLVSGVAKGYLLIRNPSITSGIIVSTALT